MTEKILVVDDSKLMTRMIEDMLKQSGYEVMSANDGPTALKLASEWTPNLILLDVMMPDMDGFEVCRRLREMERVATMPIIMVTAKSSIADKVTGFEVGADDYITKPFELPELRLRVSALLKRSQRLIAGPAAAPKPARIITVFSLRGGSGCTSLAVNLAAGLAKLWGIHVPLLDLALPFGVCDSMLNLQPRYRLDDVVNKPIVELGADVITGYLTAHESGIQLLGGFSDATLIDRFSENLVTYVLEQLRSRFRYIVIDTAHDFTPPTIAALDGADTIVIPVTPDINAARLTYNALHIFDSLGYQEEPFLTLNWTFSQQGISRIQLEKFLKQPFNLVIPYAAGVWSQAINTGVPVIEGDPESPLVAMLEDMVWRLSDPIMQKSKPDNPTPTWQRVSQRIRSSHSAERPKADS